MRSVREDARSVESDCNLVVLIGTCSRDVVVRRLPSGDEIAELQVTTRVAARAQSVPVSVVAPDAAVRAIEAGDEVAVIGAVRRRFFRAAGATASRVEVEALSVVERSDRRNLRRALRRVAASLDEMGGSPKPGSAATRRYSEPASARRRAGVTRNEKAGGQR
jgi:single-strand DNA-binding protein